MTLCKAFVNTSRLNTRYFESTIFQFFLNKLFVYLKYDRLFKIIFVGENKRKYLLVTRDCTISQDLPSCNQGITVLIRDDKKPGLERFKYGAASSDTAKRSKIRDKRKQEGRRSRTLSVRVNDTRNTAKRG